MVQASQQRLVDILDYWHKIEFFIPFDLDQVTDVEDMWKLRWIHSAQLMAWPANYFEQVKVPEDRKVTGFRLYIGLFDSAEIVEVCKRYLPDVNEDEDEERGGIEGRTCFARLELSAKGEPSFDPLSVSTVPWALGRIIESGIGSLTSAAFEAAKQNLKDRLDAFRMQRVPARSSEPAALTGNEIQQLLSLFEDWAGFAPLPGQPVLLEILTSKKREKDEQEITGVQLDEDDVEESRIDILNSFFIDDIERAMSSIMAGQAPPVLASYLTPLAQEQRVDVYTSEGRRALLRLLHPARCNRGHWLSPATHSMSLMQQFAISTALNTVRDSGLFAVNGPPGTGKTTLLREVFADTIVRRADILAQLSHAGAAFQEGRQIHFKNGKSTWIKPLKPELTGFEMVVASSNNAAVENISRDLPRKAKSLGEGWEQISYLKSVAYRLAAEDDDGYFKPTPEVEPWGLVSCALGNSDNRRRFVSKFYDNNWNDKVAPNPECQNIREWVSSYSGPSFAQAAATYRACAGKLQAASRALEDYVTLWHQCQGADVDVFCQAERATVMLAEERAAQASADKTAAEAAWQRLLRQQQDLREDERLLGLQRPGWWTKWFKPAVASLHRQDCVTNASAQRVLLRQVAAAEEALQRCGKLLDAQLTAVETARGALQQRRQLWDEQQERLARLGTQFAFKLPLNPDELEQDDFQIAGLWHEPALAHLRSELFAAALGLHEAWLAEVAKKNGGFGGNMFALAQLLKNQLPDDASCIPLIWQSLFMAVPVVSTTFASFARQFRGMGSGSIGWLFIDEAGQAVPQAAVGALWRAQRAIVVGDPLQIEPVFTVPQSVIRAFSQQSSHTAHEAYAPDKVSVQRLADDASRYGTLVPQAGDEGLWIGSPLRVHRRCADPMFSLANAIAYEGKMVIEMARRQPKPLKVPMGESSWIEVSGQVVFKQVVPEQVDFVATLIARLYAIEGSLPAMYVISPFKAVRNALRTRITELAWPGKPPTKTMVKKWCNERVGTVHTFQGKEEAVVLMVLGVDRDHAGSATWAATKPNLLNVALTRAQHYFYMVGAADVWRVQSYFGAAYARLPKRSASEFMAGIGQP